MTQQYSRQLLLWGHKNQRKIEAGSIAIIGSSLLAQYVAACSTALGIGHVILMNNEKTKNNFDFLVSKPHETKVDSFAHTLRKINPDTLVTPLATPYSPELLRAFDPDLVIHTENSLSDNYFTTIGIMNNVIMKNPGHTQSIQHPCAAGVAAGLITEMIRREYVVLEREEQLEQIPFISLNSTPSFQRALVVGAGALGNFVSLALLYSGVKNIDIVDNDTVDITNLNRQIVLYDAIGKSKSKTLTKRLRTINPQTQLRYSEKKFTRDFRLTNYDAIFGCVDNAKARKEMSEWARAQNIPYIDGGTSSQSGSVYVATNNTACMSCQKNLENMIRHEEGLQQGCAVSAPSVVVPNILIGNLMVYAASVLNHNSRIHPLKYQSKNATMYPLNLNQPRRNCQCIQ